MALSIAENAREWRRAALASLNALIANGHNVVPIFDGVIRRRAARAKFHTARRCNPHAAKPAPVLVLTNPIAA